MHAISLTCGEDGVLQEARVVIDVNCIHGHTQAALAAQVQLPRGCEKLLCLGSVISSLLLLRTVISSLVVCIASPACSCIGMRAVAQQWVHDTMRNAIHPTYRHAQPADAAAKVQRVCDARIQPGWIESFPQDNALTTSSGTNDLLQLLHHTVVVAVVHVVQCPQPALDPASDRRQVSGVVLCGSVVEWRKSRQCTLADGMPCSPIEGGHAQQLPQRCSRSCAIVKGRAQTSSKAACCTMPTS